jgi:hypothetical protein
VDIAGVDAPVRLLHTLEHDGTIILKNIPHQVYTVLEAAPVLGVPHRLVEFEVRV